MAAGDADATRSELAFVKMSRSILIHKYGSVFSKAGLATLVLTKGTASQFILFETRHLSSAALTKVIKWTAVNVVGLGAFDAVSGATQITQIAPSAGSSTVPAKAGELLNLVYQITGAPHQGVGPSSENFLRVSIILTQPTATRTASPEFQPNQVITE